MLNMTAVGRIGRDVELRRTPGGDAVCNVVIGCNYGRKGEGNNQPTQWVEGALWGARAEALAEYLTKGKQVILVLEDVHIETYEGQNGQGNKLVGRVTGLEFGASPQGEQGGGQQRQQPQGRGDGHGAPQRSQGQQRQQAPARSQGGQQRQQSRPASGFDDMDSDIPF